MKSAERLNDVDSMLHALSGSYLAKWRNRQPQLALLAARRFHEVANANGRTTDTLVGRFLIGSCLHTIGDQRTAEFISGTGWSFMIRRHAPLT